MSCKHCGKPIKQSYSKYTLGWTHEGGDAYCRLTFAEPDVEVGSQS